MPPQPFTTCVAVHLGGPQHAQRVGMRVRPAEVHSRTLAQARLCHSPAHGRTRRAATGCRRPRAGRGLDLDDPSPCRPGRNMAVRPGRQHWPAEITLLGRIPLPWFTSPGSELQPQYSRRYTLPLLGATSA